MKILKNKTLIGFILVLVFILLINFIGELFFFRIDLTSEKRYTLSEITTQKLENLDDIVFFKIYLEGNELPPDIAKLRKSVEEILNEFRVYGGENIAFEFINPNENENKKSRNKLYKELISQGISPITVRDKDEEGGTSQKVIFTGGLAYYKGREIPIEFLKNNPHYAPEQNLNSSIEDIEFTLMSAIRSLSHDGKDKIAFIEGQGELSKEETADIVKSLSDFYDIERVKIDEKIYALSTRVERDSTNWASFNKYKALIIANPTQKFSEKDKFIIDQFLMNGGRILWLQNGTSANMDSLAYMPFSMAMIPDLNIQDQLFTYGVRINPNIIQDVQSASIPVNTAPIGSKYPNFKLFRWPFFPLANPSFKHAISRNLNLIKTEFPSSIDTIGIRKAIKRTILLRSSNHAKILNAPVRISLSSINMPIDENIYTKKNIPIACLLEGSFTSNFKGRIDKSISQASAIKFREHSVNTKMIVVADASIIKNNIKRTQNGYTPLPLEIDKYTHQVYGNKTFLINAINYLCDDSGILNMRAKDFKIRMLDDIKLKGNTLSWEILNLILPIILVLLIGLVIFVIRRKKYN